MKQFRQGDLLFDQVQKLPSGKKVKRQNGHILEGEATGHIHQVAELEQAEVLEIGNGLFISVGDQGVSIIHPDHGTLELPTGNFRIQRQREYSPSEIRSVQD
jgi:hypothetical protein